MGSREERPRILTSSPALLLLVMQLQKKSLNLLEPQFASLKWGPLEHLLHKSVKRSGMGTCSGNPQPQKDGRAPQPRVCYSDDLTTHFSQAPFQMTQEKYLGVSLEIIVGFYLINSVNPVIDLISSYLIK